MKHLIKALTLILCSHFAISQQIPGDQVNSNNQNKVSKLHLSLLEEEVGDAQVLFIGEQHHGDGGAMVAKTILVKHLVENMGFEAIAFEADFYSLNDLTKNIDQKWTYLPGIWENSIQMQELYDFIKSTNLHMTGFDLMGLEDLDGFTDWYWEKVSEHTELNQNEFQEGLKAIFFNTKTKKKHIKEIYRLNLILENEVLDSFEQQLVQSFSLIIESYKNIKKAGRGFEKYKQRDAQMAQNLNWLMNHTLKDKKVIVWAANYHIAKNPNAIESEKSWYFKSGKLVSMGDVFVDLSSLPTYHLAVTSYAGEYTEWAHKSDHYVEIKPERHNENSLELQLSKEGIIFAFVPLKYVQNEFSLSGFAHKAFRGDWKEVFDGILFINEMTPSTYVGD